MTDRKRKKRRGPLRRALKGLLWLLVAFMLYNAIGGYIPFARFPELSDPAEADARVEAMLHDIDSPDRAAILETSTAALDERIRMMELAQREIIITTYECHDGESTRDLLAMACHKAREGVKVRFLADGIAGRLDIMGNDFFKVAAGLENVEIRFYNLLSPFTAWKHMGRMHDKYVIADDVVFILGGRNMYDGFLGDYPTKRHRSCDREALVFNGASGTSQGEESALFALRDYFEGLWTQADTTAFEPSAPGDARRGEVLEALEARYQRLRSERPELFQPPDYAAVTEPTDGIWLLSNPTGIYAKQPLVFESLCALMRQARQGVVLHSPYAVLNEAMRGALAEITARVPVTLMVNAVENGANVVASSDFLYHRDEVLSTGVTLLEYAGGLSYHGKSLAIDDDLSVIGSYNLDMRSSYVDTELMLVIRGREINEQLRAHLDVLHAACRRVAPDGSETVPDGLEIPPLPLWKNAALHALGALMQLTRNLL